MNREFLKNLGLEDEVVEKVMAEYGKSVQDLKPAKDELETIQSEKAALEKQLGELQQTLSTKDEELKSIDDLKNQIELYKLKDIKTNIAVQAGIPLELAGRLSGETEEEIKADAEGLAELVKKPILPMKSNEPGVKDKNKGMNQMLDDLTEKN